MTVLAAGIERKEGRKEGDGMQDRRGGEKMVISNYNYVNRQTAQSPVKINKDSGTDITKVICPYTTIPKGRGAVFNRIFFSFLFFQNALELIN